MKIVTTFHPSSSVVSSVKCCLSSRDLEHLVVAKIDRIDVYSLQPHGLKHECGVEIWGKVLCLKAIPILRTGRSKLVLMTSHPDPELVFFSYKELEGGSSELSVNKSLSLYERSPPEAEFCNDLLVHPSGKLAIATCYTGKLKVIQLKAGDYVQDFDSMLPPNVLSLAFLPVEGYTIAILHLDPQSRVRLLARDLPSSPEAEVSTLPSVQLSPTVISNKIITYPVDFVPQLVPVQPSDSYEGGVLVVGGTSVLYYELASEADQSKLQGKIDRLEKQLSNPDQEKVKQAKEKQAGRESKKRKATASVEWPWEEISAWCEVDDGRFFIGDVCGGLSLLSVDGTGLALIPLGRTSPPTTLTYLTNQIIFVGSHLGDSQIVQILPIPPGSQEPVQSVPPTIKTVSRGSKLMPDSKGKQRAVDNDSDMDVDEEEERTGGRVIAPEGSHLKVLQTFKNLGPINDAIVVDTEGSGQQDIITCSGGYNTGSLNIVRSGAEFKEVATVPGIYNVEALWSLKNNFEDRDDSHLAVSTHDRTLLFRLKGEGRHTALSYQAEKSAGDFVTRERTLALSNMRKRKFSNQGATYEDSNWVVQVTPGGVHLLEEDVTLGGYHERVKWTPPNNSEIVVASVNPSQVALALDSKDLSTVRRVVVLKVNVLGTAFEPFIDHTIWKTVSAISCHNVDPSKPYTSHVTLAYWESGNSEDDIAVEVFQIKKAAAGSSVPAIFVSVATVSRRVLPGLVRSILPCSFGSTSTEDGQLPYLLCGTAEGSVAHFIWNNGSLSEGKVAMLGYHPVHLVPCTVDGKRAVWAVGNRATIFTSNKKRLVHSPVMLKGLTAVSTLNTPTFSNSFVLSTAEGLAVGSVRDLGKISIRTIPMGFEVPSRIAHIPSANAFAVACTEHKPGRVGDDDRYAACLKLMDDSSFRVLSEFRGLLPSEEAISALAVLNASVGGKEKTLLCIGTTVAISQKARLLLFSTESSETILPRQEFVPVTTRDVNGQGINALRIVDGYIVAAIDSAVVSYALNIKEDGAAMSLDMVGEWNHNYVVRSLGSFNNRIVIGDIASSVSLVNLEKGKIVPIARDYAPLFPFALEALSEDSFIGGNDASNLFTFTLGQRGLNRKVLDRDGSYFVGDLPTKFIRGNLSSESSSSDTFEPVSIFFTSCGRIAVVIDVKDQELGQHLSELQRNLSAHIQGIGASSHSRFRAPRNKRSRTDAESDAVGFIDGDFIESFLGLLGDQGKVNEVMAGQIAEERLKLPVTKIQKYLEALQALH